ncbi:MAG TPA: hypothetical protein VK488_00275 [Gaiellaceae bacterium]|nr:hypothetical protein [Gaiellaceae bacterium]
MLKMAFAVCLAALAIAGTAAATPPISTVVSADGTFTDTFDCSFPLQETVSGSYRDTFYFDSAGNPVREILTSQFGGPLTVTWTNLATGSTLSSHEAAPLIIYYNPDGSFASLQNVGLIFNVTIPGHGTVLLDVGRVVIVRHQGIVFEAGPHQEENGDTAAFCAALT